MGWHERLLRVYDALDGASSEVLNNATYEYGDLYRGMDRRGRTGVRLGLFWTVDDYLFVVEEFVLTAVNRSMNPVPDTREQEL